MTLCCDLSRERQCVGVCMTDGTEVVFARDSRGGYFAAADQAAMDRSEPIYYIDAGLVCHRLTPMGDDLADAGESWRQTMEESGEVDIFPDRAAARRRYGILTLQELLEEAK